MGRFWTTVAVVAGLWVVLDWYFRKDSSSSDREDGSPPSDQIRPPPDVRVLRPPPRQYTPVVRGRGRGARRIVRLPPSDTAIPPPLRESQDDLPLSGAVLRERAAEANRLRGEAFAESQNMHRLGLRDEARRLSQEGKEHKERMDKLNKAASERIFLENNENRNDIDGVDLHRLFVKEALLKVQEVILAAQRRGESTVRFIVGQGLHSIDGAPRLKPELTSRIQAMGHTVSTDPRNAGVLVVSLTAPRGQRGPRVERVSGDGDMARAAVPARSGSYISINPVSPYDL